MATNLYRSYHWRKEKQLSEIVHLIEQYFKSFPGMDVCCTRLNKNAYRITCHNANLLKGENNLPGLARKATGLGTKAAGFDTDLSVLLSVDESSLNVEYNQEISELPRAIKAVFTGWYGIGLLKLGGIAARHDIPFKLNEIISGYLRR